MSELVLPAFHLDCRDWLVVTPEEAGLPDEVGGSPLLAVLSTVVLDCGDFKPASGVLTVGLLDVDLPSRPIGDECVAEELLDEPSDRSLRYLMPSPDGRLAVVAEFELTDGVDRGVVERVETLMRSFRWAA